MNTTTEETIDKVDTRKLSNGQFRLRFRLSNEAVDTVNEALNEAYEQTHYRTDGTRLDLLAMSFLAGPRPSLALGHPAEGRERFLVRLYPDQYETVRLALDRARCDTSTDSQALVLIADEFLRQSRGATVRRASSSASAQFVHSRLDVPLDGCHERVADARSENACTASEGRGPEEKKRLSTRAERPENADEHVNFGPATVRRARRELETAKWQRENPRARR